VPSACLKPHDFHLLLRLPVFSVAGLGSIAPSHLLFCPSFIAIGRAALFVTISTSIHGGYEAVTSLSPPSLTVASSPHHAPRNITTHIHAVATIHRFSFSRFSSFAWSIYIRSHVWTRSRSLYIFARGSILTIRRLIPRPPRSASSVFEDLIINYAFVLACIRQV